MLSIKYIELDDLYNFVDSTDSDDYDDSDYESEKMVTILEKDNVAYGMESDNYQFILGQEIEPQLVELYNKVTLKNGRTHTLYKIETDNKYNINYISCSPMLFLGIKYKDICFWNKPLINEIEKLLRYSYCLIDKYDTFYFPIIKLVIWTIKSVKKLGYSYAIYDYYCYDKFYNKQICDIINNKNKIDIGKILLYKNKN